MSRPSASWLAWPLAALALAACPAPAARPPASSPTPAVLPFPGPTPAAAHSTAAVERAACQAFAGAGTPLVAPADPADAPVLAPGLRYDVALGSARTHLALTVPRPGEWSVFLGQDHFFLVFGPDEGVAFTLEDAPGSAACAGVGRHAVFQLEPGLRYRLELAAKAGATLMLFVGETHPAGG